jgi:hypothetical protein
MTPSSVQAMTAVWMASALATPGQARQRRVTLASERLWLTAQPGKGAARSEGATPLAQSGL